MLLQECYQKMGGDYNEVLGRLVSVERIEKYVVKFLDDPTYRLLCEAKAAGDAGEVFLNIHTLKGVSQNLGFGNLYEACYRMTEEVRGGKPLEDEKLFEAVSDAYYETIEIIKQFAESAIDI